METETTIQHLKRVERQTRKQIILTAALKLFSEDQISNVGMRDIAKEAGVSPALIYRHFKDRDELFIEAFVKESQKMIENFETNLSSEQVITVEKISKEFIRYLIEHPLLFRMMTYFMLDHTLINEHMDRFNVTMRELLAIFDQGFEHQQLTKDVRLHSHALFSALNGIMITFYHYPGRTEEDIESHIDRLTSLIVTLFEKAE